MEIDPQTMSITERLFAKALGWIGEPAKKFIDARIEEHNLVGRAKAENNVMLIDTAYDIPRRWIESSNPIEQRRGLRVLGEVVREQRNIEDVVMEASTYLSESARPEDIDDDWLANHFDHARKVSDSDMRTLWARLLAGEADNPGSFSKKTVNVLADMDKETATAFASLCKFNCNVGGTGDRLFILDDGQEIYESNNIDFDSEMALRFLGLVDRNNMGFTLNFSVYTFSIFYFDVEIVVNLKREKSLYRGILDLTPFGEQLATLVQPVFIPEFPGYIVDYYRQNTDNSNVVVSDPIYRATL